MLVAPAHGRPPPCDLWAGSWPDRFSNGPGARPLPSGKPLWSWSHTGTASVLHGHRPQPQRVPHRTQPRPPAWVTQRTSPVQGSRCSSWNSTLPLAHLCSLALVCHTTMTYTKGSMAVCSFQRPTNAPAPPPSYPRGCSSRQPALLAAAHSQISRWSLSFFQVVLPVTRPRTAVCGLSVCLGSGTAPSQCSGGRPRGAPLASRFLSRSAPTCPCRVVTCHWPGPQPQCSLACSRC